MSLKSELPFETSRVLSPDGSDLALHHFGGSGEPLLICHATGFHGLAYLPMVQHLVDHFEVWALDFRGHGASVVPNNGDFSWEKMGHDVAAVIKAIARGPLLALGHSMGGASILRVALHGEAAIESAYLFEPIVFPRALMKGPQQSMMSAVARMRRSTFESRTAVLERYGSRPPLNMLDAASLEAYIEYGFVETNEGEVTLACLPEHEARTFEAPDKSSLEDLDGLSLPVVIARGALEGDWSPAHASGPAADAIVSAQLSVHDDLGHFGPLQAPERIANEATRWFKTGRL